MCRSMIARASSAGIAFSHFFGVALELDAHQTFDLGVNGHRHQPVGSGARYSPDSSKQNDQPLS